MTEKIEPEKAFYSVHLGMGIFKFNEDNMFVSKVSIESEAEFPVSKKVQGAFITQIGLGKADQIEGLPVVSTSSKTFLNSLGYAGKLYWQKENLVTPFMLAGVEILNVGGDQGSVSLGEPFLGAGLAFKFKDLYGDLNVSYRNISWDEAGKESSTDVTEAMIGIGHNL